MLGGQFRFLVSLFIGDDFPPAERRRLKAQYYTASQHQWDSATERIRAHCLHHCCNLNLRLQNHPLEPMGKLCNNCTANFYHETLTTCICYCVQTSRYSTATVERNAACALNCPMMSGQQFHDFLACFGVFEWFRGNLPSWLCNPGPLMAILVLWSLEDNRVDAFVLIDLVLQISRSFRVFALNISSD